MAGGAVALPGRVMRAPFARAARVRAGAVLDALLRGRAWIALLAVLLVGIVFFNVDLLELNRDIAQTSDKAAQVKRQNATLRLEVARLASSERIQRVAARRGLELPAPGDVRYLRAHPADARNAAARMTEPGEGSATPVTSGAPVQSAPTAQQTPPTTQQTTPQTTTPTQTPTPPPTTTTPTTPQTGPTVAQPTAGSPTGGAAPTTTTGNGG